MGEDAPQQIILPLPVWLVLAFMAGLAVAGGSLTISDLVTVSELAECVPAPEPEPEPEPEPAAPVRPAAVEPQA